MVEKILFAWATPAFVPGSPVDHTWITTYDSRQTPYNDIEDVKLAGEENWYCWGAFHPTGKTLSDQTGDLDCANCLVLPNIESQGDVAARGTIFEYGIDGVCHQLANQVLFATATPQTPALTVAVANGYRASSFLYGTYGRRHSEWQTKKYFCCSKLDVIKGAKPLMPEDEFEEHARSVLSSEDQPLLEKLLELRRTARERSVVKAGAMPTAEEINSVNQQTLDEAARLLGSEKFQAIFGYSPEERVNLIDPEILSRSRAKE